MLIVYDKDSGAISQLIASGEFESLRTIYEGKGFGVLSVNRLVDFSDHCVVGGEIVERGPWPVVAPKSARGGEAFALRGFPVPCQVQITFDKIVLGHEQVTPPDLEIVAKYPGRYEFLLQPAGRYRPTVIKVEIVR